MGVSVHSMKVAVSGRVRSRSYAKFSISAAYHKTRRMQCQYAPLPTIVGMPCFPNGFGFKSVFLVKLI